MDARTILQQQHHEIRSLFKRLTGSEGRSEERKDGDAVLARLTARLQLHTRLEESYFYSALTSLETKKAEETVLESYEEHAIVDALLAGLPAMEVADRARFLARARVLQSLVETHIEEEESVMFELAEKLGNDRLIAIGERMQLHIEEVESVAALLERAAEATRQTERWAGRWIDRSLDLSRRTASRLAPTRLIGLEQARPWLSAITAQAPIWLIDGAYGALTRLEAFTGGRDGNGQRRGPSSLREGASRTAA